MFLALAMLLMAQVEAQPMRVRMVDNAEFKVWGGPFSAVPSTAEARAAYPLSLRATTSSVALLCLVSEHGTITKCEVRNADPDQPGPKDAALKLLPYFRVTTHSAGSKIAFALQFSGKVWRCLMPFCMPDLIPPPPSPPPGVCIQPVNPDYGPPCPEAKPRVH